MNEMILGTLSKGHELDIDSYKTIFNILHEEHNNYCEEWLFNNSTKFNLKKICVCDIYNEHKGINELFKKYIDSYLDGLPCLYSKIMERIDNECHFFIRGRAKAYESMIFKMHSKNKKENGKFPISKCLNDLLGFRIIDSNYNHNIENIKNYLEYLRKHEHRIRHIDRNNDNYKGYHIYFLGQNNHSFPIELQIWNHEYEQKNIESHRLYKQEYFQWIDKYNDI